MKGTCRIWIEFEFLTQQSYQFLLSSLLLPFSRGITSLEYFDHWEAKVYEYQNLCALLISGESLKVLAQENLCTYLASIPRNKIIVKLLIVYLCGFLDLSLCQGSSGKARHWHGALTCLSYVRKPGLLSKSGLGIRVCPFKMYCYLRARRSLTNRLSKPGWDELLSIKLDVIGIHQEREKNNMPWETNS